MSPQVIGMLGIVALIVLLVVRVPVALAMLAVGFVGNALIVSPSAALSRLGSDVFQQSAAYNLSVIPLFVFMGLLLANAGLGADLYRALDAFLWRMRGGLGVATVGAATLFGSVSGSAVASATTMSTVAVPEMRRYNYDPGHSAATAAVGGTLGSLIPPSAALVLYGVLTEESIGAILIAAIIPGLMTAGLVMLTAYLVVVLRPHLAPQKPERPQTSKLTAIRLIWPVPVIFGISMGGLYAGVFTPTEAGSAGAFIALVYGVVTRRLKRQGFAYALSRTVRVSAFIFFLVIGGKVFGFFLTVTRIPRDLGRWVAASDLSPILVLAIIFLIYFILGALMDELAILVIMTPIMYPIVIGLGYSGVWFGVLTIMMLLTGLLTPPVGLITFVVSGITRIPLESVFRGVTPFWIALAVAVMLVIMFPQISLALLATR